MGTLVFECPVSRKTFKSEFQATAEDLKSIQQGGTIELQCEICKSRHKFELARCSIDEEK